MPSISWAQCHVGGGWPVIEEKQVKLTMDVTKRKFCGQKKKIGFVFLELNLRHMEVPRLGVESEL